MQREIKDLIVDLMLCPETKRFNTDLCFTGKRQNVQPWISGSGYEENGGPHRDILCYYFLLLLLLPLFGTFICPLLQTQMLLLPAKSSFGPASMNRECAGWLVLLSHRWEPQESWLWYNTCSPPIMIGHHLGIALIVMTTRADQYMAYRLKVMIMGLLALPVDWEEENLKALTWDSGYCPLPSCKWSWEMLGFLGSEILPQRHHPE